MGALLIGFVLVAGSLGCQSQEADSTSERPIAEVIATDSSLSVREAVPAGWVTFRMENEGTAHHSFKLRKLPEGQTVANYRRAVLAPADSFEALLVEGRIDSSTYRQEMRKRVPEWLQEVTTVGGITGLAPGRSAQVTHDLAPGHYVLECFFRTPENRTHALLGVQAGLRVTGDSSGAAPPTADLTAELSPEAFDVDSSSLSDEQTLAFRSVGGPEKASSPYVGLFRLTDETGTGEVLAWIDRGLPLPAPTDWIGGPEPMPAGDVGYVTVGDLPPGRYAWITERAPDTTGMVKTFTVGAR